MCMAKMGRIRILTVMAFLLGSVLLLSCQPAQPVATPKATEKGAAATPSKAEATTPAKAAEKPVRGGTLRFAILADLSSLDPNSMTTQPGMYSIYEQFIQSDKDSKPTKEGLAKDWTISGDGKSITFKLREGVKFQDGTEFNAAAVKFNIDRMKDPATKSPFAAYYEFVTSVDVVDNLTVRFNLSQPDVLTVPRLAGATGGLMVSPAAVKKYGQDYPRNPVGTGPFQFVEWVPGDRVTLKRFDGYWKKDKDGVQLPYLEGVVFKIITDASTAVANLRTGQVDLVAHGSGVPVELRELVKNDPNLSYELRERSTTSGTTMNTKKPPFDNKALRQAVALAVDREGMSKTLGATLVASLFHPIDKVYDDGKAAVYPSRDVAKAKAKMAEAGYPAGGVKVKYTSSNAAESVKEAEITKANLAEIGIEVEIEAVASSAWNTKVRVNWDYQMSSSSTNGALGDPGQYLANQFHSKGARNYFGPYSNPQVDQAIDKGISTYDQKERTAAYQQAAKLIVDDAPFVSLFTGVAFGGKSAKVRNHALWYDLYERVGETWLAQ